MIMTTNLPKTDDWGIPITLNEEMGHLLEAVSPDDAILMWPITIMGERDAEGTDIHITLNWGKWAGTEEELREALAGLLEGKNTKLPMFTQWVPDEFKGREKSFKVLTVPQIKEFVAGLRRDVDSVFPDHFGSNYMPHVTVSEKLWKAIRDNKLTPQEARVFVGPLELRLGLKKIVLEEGRYPLPQAQKMVLNDMAVNKRRWREWPGGFYVPEGEERARGQERLFSSYVLWGVFRSLLRKGLIVSKVEKGVTYYAITPDGLDQVRGVA